MTRYWNAMAAVVSLVLVVVFSFVPALSKHVDGLLVVCAGAVVLLLIEIRLELDQERAAVRMKPFSNMRAARSEIVARMSEVITKGGADETEIVIVGGRIRTVTDILRDLCTDVQSGRVRGSNVQLRVLALDPVFLKQLRLPGNMPSERQAQRAEGYAAMVEGAAREIEDLARLDAIQRQNIQLAVAYYSTVPDYYCFLLGRRYLFWGFYTWDASTSDLVGPDNRCYFVSHIHPEFEHYYRWFQNRVELFGALAGAVSVVDQTGVTG